MSLSNSKSQKILPGQVDGDGTDIISTLPDNLLLHILSFLPMKDVLRTSALSKRWKHLWTCVSDIEFDDFNVSLSSQSDIWTSFLDSVERVLLLHDSSCIRKFRLILYEDDSASHVSSWVSAAVSHKVQELRIILCAETHLVLPDCLFTSESLTTLELILHFEVHSLNLIHLSNLKILRLRVTFPSDQFAEQLFSGCPVLEELSLDDCNWENNKKITISVPSLRKLSISCRMDHELYDCVINIYAENLVSLECSNCLEIELVLHNMPTLITACIDESYWEIESYFECAVHYFMGFVM